MTMPEPDQRRMDWEDLPWGNSDFELCESPMETEVLHCLNKYVADGVKIVPQWEIETICGTFRADFLVANQSRFLIIESDGQEYHEGNRDEWRDAMIMGTGKLDAIYRLRGQDIWYHRDDVFFVMANWEPSVFSPGLADKLSRVASEKLVASECWKSGAIAMHAYWDLAQNRMNPPTFWVERRCLVTTPDIGKRQFWTALFEFAQRCGGGSLDELIAKWRSEHQ